MISRTGEGRGGGTRAAVLSLDTPPNLGLYPVWVGTETLSALEKEEEGRDPSQKLARCFHCDSGTGGAQALRGPNSGKNTVLFARL